MPRCPCRCRAAAPLTLHRLSMPIASFPAATRSDPRLQRLQRWDRFVWVFLIIGSVLRLIWPLDMEWKYDEKWMFAKGLAISQGHDAWPWVGMASGVGLRNPGMSIWPFGALAYIAPSPVAMTFAIALINTLGIWALALWVRHTWPREQQALGLWGVALFAVTPLSVLFSRKIWAQDVLIALVVPWLWGHRKRHSFAGAFVWGCFGALLGQIHMSGFFAAAALLIVTVFQERLRFNVVGWLLGSVLGSLTLLPWIAYVFSPETHSASHAGWSIKFFVEALRHAWGLGLEYPLGRAYHELLKGPVVAGVATHLAQVARYGLLLLLLWGIIARAYEVRQRKALRLPEPIYTYAGCVLVTGLLMVAARVEVYEHYLIVLGPMLHITAIWLVLSRRVAALSLCALQAFLTACFLVFIHSHGGAPDADYGKAYSAQTAEERSLPPLRVTAARSQQLARNCGASPGLTPLCGRNK